MEVVIAIFEVYKGSSFASRCLIKAIIAALQNIYLITHKLKAR
jgi:hypothetical protein